jgi:hypothetical protein
MSKPLSLMLRARKPLPLTTVELQKSGSRLLKLSPKKILDVSSRFTLSLLSITMIDRLPSISISKGSSLIQERKQTSMTHNLILRH